MFATRPLRCLLPAGLERWVALLGAGLVGLLSLATVSPDVHAMLHGDYQDLGVATKHGEDTGHPPAPEHTCAVTLFSQGIESGFPLALLLGASESLDTDVLTLADQLARSARAVQLPPGRGPPAC